MSQLAALTRVVEHFASTVAVAHIDLRGGDEVPRRDMDTLSSMLGELADRAELALNRVSGMPQKDVA